MVLLRIKWKFELINALSFEFWPKLWIRNEFELKIWIRNYFGLFLQIRTLFNLKFELEWDLLQISCWRCWDRLIQSNALNAMYVEDIEDGVCSFYATLHTECYFSSHSCQRCQILLYSVYSGLSSLSGGKAIHYSIWKAFHLEGLAVHHQSVQGGRFVDQDNSVKFICVSSIY